MLFGLHKVFHRLHSFLAQATDGFVWIAHVQHAQSLLLHRFHLVDLLALVLALPHLQHDRCNLRLGEIEVPQHVLERIYILKLVVGLAALPVNLALLALNFASLRLTEVDHPLNLPQLSEFPL